MANIETKHNKKEKNKIQYSSRMTRQKPNSLETATQQQVDYLEFLVHEYGVVVVTK